MKKKRCTLILEETNQNHWVEVIGREICDHSKENATIIIFQKKGPSAFKVMTSPFLVIAKQRLCNSTITIMLFTIIILSKPHHHLEGHAHIYTDEETKMCNH